MRKVCAESREILHCVLFLCIKGLSLHYVGLCRVIVGVDVCLE